MSGEPLAWQRVKDLFGEVQQLPIERRAAYLDAACGEDHGLRVEVESLLASYETSGDFLERPAVRVFGSRFTEEWVEGRLVGPYCIGARIGAGGMGDVYRALDTRLGRHVAIKVLPPPLATDPGRERFEREARAVAALNHPHICTLYDVGVEDGVHFLVMELLEGETLSARLSRGPLPPAKALEYAAQIASALDRAHRGGIVHRDLKPSNVMLTTAGAKLLDFGLAKPPMPGPEAGDPPRDLTGPGVVLGTAHYISPEQLEGKDADARSDLFAFGAMLHETLTGRKAFDAPSSARLAAAILSSEVPRVSEVAPRLPAFLDYVVQRCLAKDPDERWQTARDLLAELERSRASLQSSGATRVPDASRTDRPGGGRGGRVAWLGALAIAMVLVVAAVAYSARPAPIRGVAWLSILPPPGGFDLSPDPAVSPDGQLVAYKAMDESHRTHVWVKSLRSADAHPIPGTETDFTTGPFWAPDSRSIGFFANGKLKRVGVDGSALQIVANAPEPRGGTWTASGVIIFNADTQNLMRVPAGGGTATTIANRNSGGIRLFPHALPDGDHYLFTSRDVDGQGQGVYVGSLSHSEVRRVSEAWSPAAYAAGQMVFARQGGLFTQAFDLEQLRVVGEPRQIADGVGVGYGTPLSFPFSVSPDVITYWGRSASPTTQLTWFGRSGERLAVAGDSAVNYGFSVTNDGRRVAIESGNDVWLLDLQRGAGAARLTSNGSVSAPVLSPSGDRVAFMERGRGIVSMSIAKSTTQLMVEGSASKWPIAWSQDGHLLTYLDATPTGWRIWTVTDRPGAAPALYRDAPFTLSAPELSPDGRWLAYGSNESGRHEVYVDSFPTPTTRSRVSADGGSWPKWRNDGRELYYLAPDRRLMVSRVSLGDEGPVFAPAIGLFEAPGVNPDIDRTQFWPSPDGSRFLFNARVESTVPAGLTVIVNWSSLDKR